LIAVNKTLPNSRITKFRDYAAPWGCSGIDSTVETIFEATDYAC